MPHCSHSLNASRNCLFVVCSTSPTVFRSLCYSQRRECGRSDIVVSYLPCNIGSTLSLPDNHFLFYAITRSLALARAKKPSWTFDLARVLHLPYQWICPVSGSIDNLITAVEQSCLVDIESFIAASSKTLFLRYRSVHQTDPDSNSRKTPVAWFRFYLDVPIPAHSLSPIADIIAYSRRRGPTMG